MIVKASDPVLRSLERAYQSALLIGYITIAYGRRRDIPDYLCEGKASLKVKYRKRWRFIQGRIEAVYEGLTCEYEETYSYRFVPLL